MCGKDDLERVPLFSALADGVQGIYLHRGGGQTVIDKIVARQKQIEEEGQAFNPVLFFVEGTTTNGTHLLRFRQGAFHGLYTVSPVFFTVSTCGMVDHNYDILAIQDLVVLAMSSCSMYNLKVHRMPDFTPNEYLFETHAH